MTKKKQILEDLKNCKPEQVGIFIRMYGEIGESIESVVSELPSSKVSWALKQV